MDGIDFNEYFYYDETSPSFLRWRVDVMSGHNYKTKSAKIGDVVGTLDNGYWRTRVKGPSYLVHRIVAAIHGEKIDGMIVDHIDGNSENNSIANLRVCTISTNVQNSKMPSTNSSGVVGVTWHTSDPNVDGTVRTYAMSHHRENGKPRFKYFAVHDYGLLPAFSKALHHRTSEIARLNNSGASYTERHGKRLPA